MEGQDFEEIKTIASLAMRLQNLCEGFDETSKNAIISAKFKVLLELSKKDKLSPAEIKQNLGLAKSNVSNLCGRLVEDGEIAKSKEKFDNRTIFYSITPLGEAELADMLDKMQKNFKTELEYKNNFPKIVKSARELADLVK